MKLTRTAGQSAFAALIAVLSLSVVSQAWADDDCVRPSGQVRTQSIPASAASILANQNAGPGELGAALSDCGRLGPTSLPGRLCTAQAQLRLAQGHNSEFQNYDGARRDFCVAGLLAGNRSDYVVQANTGRAQALLGLRQVNPGGSNGYDAELQRVHGALGWRAPAALHWEIAQLFLAQRNENGARDEANHLLQSDRALAARTLAGVAQLQWNRGDREGARATLVSAQNADSSSVAANAALGRAYFELGDTGTAERYLRAATLVTPPPRDEVNEQEQAYYYLSVIEGSRSNYAQAISYADRAGGTPAALRQGCLARLIAGQEVYSETRDSRGRIVGMEASSTGLDRCGRLGSSPEGQLLRGMFWLRYAQYRSQVLPVSVTPSANAAIRANTNRWREALDSARQAFDDGLARLGNDDETLDWRGDQVAVSTRDALQYGRDLANYFRSACQISAPSGNAEMVFVSNGVVRDRLSSYRCRPPPPEIH